MAELTRLDFELERQTRELAEHLRRGPEGDRDKQRAALRELIERHFNARQERRRLELQRIEKEVSRLREAIEVRENQRATIIEQRMGELVGSPDKPGF